MERANRIENRELTQEKYSGNTYRALTVARLKQLCTERDLHMVGTKEQLVRRLAEYDDKQEKPKESNRRSKILLTDESADEDEPLERTTATLNPPRVQPGQLDIDRIVKNNLPDFKPVVQRRQRKRDGTNGVPPGYEFVPGYWVQPHIRKIKKK